jgi:hypothetical protein
LYQKKKNDRGESPDADPARDRDIMEDPNTVTTDGHSAATANADKARIRVNRQADNSGRR